jgi:hypothetical protein
MSTFFKSAAMSLLSKTLQTLLYRYLSDVDVEGVNLPSLLSGGGGGGGGGMGGRGDGHSGWGVRLANVVLREGAKLLDLPGQPPRRRGRGGGGGRSRRKKQKKKKAHPRKDKQPPADEDRRKPRQSRDDDPVGTGRDGRLKERSLTKSAGSDKDPTRSRKVASAAAAESSPSGFPPDTSGFGDADETIATQSTAASTAVSSSNNANVTSSAPASVAATSSSTGGSSWFYWYGSRNKTACSNNAAPSAEDATSRGVRETLQEVDGEEEEEIVSSAKLALHDDRSPDDSDPLIGKAPSRRGGHDDYATIGDGGDCSDDDDDENDDEDHPNRRGSMILRLGKASRIGVLDVRLIGKTIHVYVEDAFLCIEVVRLAPPASEGPGSAGAAATAGEGRASGGGSEATAGEAGAAPGGASPKRPPATRKISEVNAPGKDPKTTGERVMAENAVARLFSAIPNLFLRDIRIQLVLRNDLVVTTTEAEDKDSLNTPLSENDSVVDISIELLSVTDGEDFLAKFRTDASVHFEGDDDLYYSAHPNGDAENQDSMHLTERYEDLNDYLVKRIRTGRGPDGGVCVRVFPPNRRSSDPVAATNVTSEGSESHPPWARSRWKSTTDYCLLRCSGLDVHARIFLGVHDGGDDSYYDAPSKSWFATDGYEEYDVDSMLFAGVDYIVPGPRPPLPPISNSEEAALTMEADKFWTHDGATVYRTDANGIQSSSVPSAFHRVARGLTPVVSSHDHLPCEDSANCWKALPGVARSNALDGTTPMGGLVLSVMTKDPLEVNIDRSTLLVLGDLVGLFKNDTRTGAETSQEMEDESEYRRDRGSNDMGVASERSRHSYMSRNSQNSRTDLMAVAAERAHGDEQPDFVPDDLANAYPSYMQPEKIQVIGFHCSDLIFRVHVMREHGVHDDGLAFCFWDVSAKCITMDYQALSRIPEKSFDDLRLDIGYLTVNEYKGIGSKLLISLGLRQRVVDFDGMTIETLKTREELSDRPPWPSTAAALLEVQPPLETLMYEERDRHAFQFRYLSVGVPVMDPDRMWTTINLRVGPCSIDAPFAIKDDMPTVISSARSCVLVPTIEETACDRSLDDGDHPSPAIKKIMKYKIQLDGGRVNLSPRLDVKLPLTVVTGERSPELGLSFQTILDRVNFSYGEYFIEPRALECGLSLQQLSELPENVRLRLLLFLSDTDLGALERALCIKQESNSFLRCRAVNRGIVRISKRRSRSRSSLLPASNASEPMKAVNRRQELVYELLKLDDDSLEDLIMVHRRYHRKSSMRSS